MTATPRTLCLLGATSAVATAYARLVLGGAPVRLVLIGRNAGKLEQLARDLGVRGAEEVLLLAGEIGTPEALPDLFRRLQYAAPEIDEVLLAFGQLGDQAESEANPIALAGLLGTNLVAPAMWIEWFAVRFEARKHGQMTVIGSVAGDRGRQSNYHYGAAKGALERICEGLDHRFFRAGLRDVSVTLVKPGFIDTPMTGHMEKSGPLWSSPDKIAGVIAHAVRRRRARVYAPWYWRFVLLVIRALPRAILVRTKL